MNNKINKTQLSKIVKKDLENKGYKLSNKDSLEFTSSVINNLIELALNDNDIYLHGTGYIKSKIKKGRLGRNPATGEKIIIEDKKTLVLEVSRRFKESINK